MVLLGTTVIFDAYLLTAGLPSVGSEMKVECINLMQLIDAEDWILG